MRTNRSSGLACFLGLAFVCPASAATRYVDVSNATPAAPYTSWGSAATNIQTAIEAATSGDEILVAPGIYYLRGDTIYIPSDKTLTLRSTHSREAILDAEGLNQGMAIYGTNSLVEGFTIRNGGGAWLVEGGGVKIGKSSTLRDCWWWATRRTMGAAFGFTCLPSWRIAPSKAIWLPIPAGAPTFP